MFRLQSPPFLALLVVVIGFAVPAAAIAHPGHGRHVTVRADRIAVPTAAARRIDAIQDAALQTLPLATGTECGASARVVGIGAACRAADGSFRVVAGGSVVPTHGMDAPMAGDGAVAAAPTPSSQSAITAASAADIACETSATAPAYQLVYARPSDRADRSAEVASLLRREAYRASAFIDAEARALMPTAGRRLRMVCDGTGEASVLNLSLSALGTATGADFGAVVNQLVAAGLDNPSSSTSQRRYIVFYDAPNAAGAAGVGHYSTTTTAGSASSQNRGARYAMEFSWSSTRAPHWDVLLHEVGHTIGAVSDTAPDTSGAGHCNDGNDTMCYGDGGPAAAYATTSCAYERFDCDADTYWHPAPAAGTYLAANWNPAATYNAWVQARIVDSSGEPGDTTPPTAPGAPTLTGVTATTLDVSWGSATDDVGVAGYVADLYRRSSTGALTLLATSGTTTSLGATFTGLVPSTAYTVQVRAVDAVGNEGAAASVEGSTAPDTTAPAAPVPTLVDATITGMQVRWARPSDDIGSAGYRFSWTKEGAMAPVLTYDRSSTGSSYTFTLSGALEPGTRYEVAVQAYDAAGNLSTPGLLLASTLADTAAPSAPGAPSLTSVTASSIAASWTAATDNDRVAGYETRLEQFVAGAWSELEVRPTMTARSVTFDALASGTYYRIAARALDRSGNAGAWVTVEAQTAGGVTEVDPGGTPPPTPTLQAPAPTVLTRRLTSLDVTWGVDEQATSWDVTLRDGAGTVLRMASGLTTPSITLGSLRSGTAYRVDVVARSGNLSPSAAGTVLASTLADTRGPTAPRWSTYVTRTTSSLTVRWYRSTDDVGVASYRIYRYMYGRYVLVASPSASAQAQVFARLPRRTTHTFVIRAVDTSGNISPLSTVLRAATT